MAKQTAPDSAEFDPEQELQATLNEFEEILSRGDFASMKALVELLRGVIDYATETHDFVLHSHFEKWKMEDKLSTSELEERATALSKHIWARAHFRHYVAEGVLQRAILGLPKIASSDTEGRILVRNYNDQLGRTARLNTVLLAYAYVQRPELDRTAMADFVEEIRSSLGVEARLQEGSTYQSLMKSVYNHFSGDYTSHDHDAFRSFLIGKVQEWDVHQEWLLGLDPESAGKEIESFLYPKPS